MLIRRAARLSRRVAGCTARIPPCRFPQSVCSVTLRSRGPEIRVVQRRRRTFKPLPRSCSRVRRLSHSARRATESLVIAECAVVRGVRSTGWPSELAVRVFCMLVQGLPVRVAPFPDWTCSLALPSRLAIVHVRCDSPAGAAQCLLKQEIKVAGCFPASSPFCCARPNSFAASSPGAGQTMLESLRQTLRPFCSPPGAGSTRCIVCIADLVGFPCDGLTSFSSLARIIARSSWHKID